MRPLAYSKSGSWMKLVMHRAIRLASIIQVWPYDVKFLVTIFAECQEGVGRALP